VTSAARLPDARAAGLLLPLFSMPSTRSWGVGEFSDIAALEPWMRGAGLRVLQLLPLNEMAPGQASPYSALSAMALDPIFISVPDVPDYQACGGDASLDAAARELLAEVRASRAVDYRCVRALKDRLLRQSFQRFLKDEWARDTDRAAALRAFTAAQSWWLDGYAVFRAAHHLLDGGPWLGWPAPLRDRDRPALLRFARDAWQEVAYRQYLQWIAQEQWRAARSQAGNIRIAGDFPFGVSAESADVWSAQDLFSFDGTIGAPPDAFSDDGQNWHLPLYRWDVMRGQGYEWFRARARRMAELFDLFRVDHVVGLFRTWVFPQDDEAPHFVPAEPAAQAAQGEGVLRAILAGGADVIAEDLGTIPDFVRTSLHALGVPGYRVMRWEREWDEPGRPFIPPVTYPALSVATSGTHDTDTLASWWLQAGEAERTAALAAILPGPAQDAPLPRADREFMPAVRDALLEALYGSGSNLLILPVQDVFGWTDRINVPATIDDSNWTWKLPWPVDAMDAQAAARERQRTLGRWAGRHRGV
jgi:4-alpha-glucanotransferase